MRPILFPSTEKSFQSNGLGRLDPLSCTVTEELNGEYELEMEYRMNAAHFSEIKRGMLIYAKPAEGRSPQPFQIYKITEPIDGKITIYAEHISYRLSYTVVFPFYNQNTSTDENGNETKTNIRVSCSTVINQLNSNVATSLNGFTVSTDGSVDGEYEFNQESPASMRSIMVGGIIDVWDGEWIFDMFTAKYVKKKGSKKDLRISYGKNMTDLTVTDSLEEVVSGIAPFYGTGDTMVTLPEKVLYASTSSIFDYTRVSAVDMGSYFDGTPTVDELRSQARRYIEATHVGEPKITIDVNMVDIPKSEDYSSYATLQTVNVGDTITIYHKDYGINSEAEIKKTVFNVNTDRYDLITIGTVENNIAESIVKISGTGGNKTTGTERYSSSHSSSGSNYNSGSKVDTSDLERRIKACENTNISQNKAIANLEQAIYKLGQSLVWHGTEADFAKLTEKDPNKIYLIDAGSSTTK